MAEFDEFVIGADALAEQILQVIYCLNGRDGFGRQLKLTSSTTDQYVIEVENQHANGKGVRIKANGVTIFQCDLNGTLISVAGEAAAAVVNATTVQTLMNKIYDTPSFTGRMVYPTGTALVALGANYQIDLAAVATRGEQHHVSAVAAATITDVLTTGISSGMRLRLAFDDTNVSVVVGNHLDLAYEFHSAPQAELLLQFDGTNWVEVSRSADSPVSVEAFLLADTSTSSSAGGSSALSWTTPTLMVGTPWTVGQATRFTPPHNGRYRIDAQLEFLANATGHRGVAYKRGGNATLYVLDRGGTLTDGTNTNVGGGETVYLTTTDYIEIVPIQTSGGGLNVIGASADKTRASFTFIGR